MSHPISPTEVEDKLATNVIPTQVWDAFNGLITTGYKQGQSIVHQDALVCRILRNLGFEDAPVNYCIVLESDWLERAVVTYKGRGWSVEYDAPDKGDGRFRPFYTFRKKVN